MINVIFKDFPWRGLRLFFFSLFLFFFCIKNISQLNTEDDDLLKEFNHTRITAYLIG